jgi:hypothetical protein
VYVYNIETQYKAFTARVRWRYRLHASALSKCLSQWVKNHQMVNIIMQIQN